MKTIHVLTLASMLATSPLQCQPINPPTEFVLRLSPVLREAPVEPPLFTTAVNRMSEHSDSRLVRPMVLDYYLSGRGLPELSASRGRSLFAEGFRYSLREWGLQTPAYLWLDDKFEHVGDWFASFWRDTLSPNVERHNVQSPREVTFEEHRDSFYGFKKGLRPFQQNPYAYFSYGLRDATDTIALESTLRIRMRDWHRPTFSFVTEAPFGSWSLGLGIEGRTGEDRRAEYIRYGQLFTEMDRAIDMSLGLRGPLFKGFVSIGANVFSKSCLAQWSLDY